MKTALVLGGSAHVWADASAALDLFTPDAVAAINDIGARWSRPIDLFVTLHPEKMAVWREERATRGFKPAKVHIGCEAKPGIDAIEDYRWPESNHSGSSGLYAIKVLLARRYDRIVLAGVPLEPSGAHFFGGPEWGAALSNRPAWLKVRSRIAPHVRSMSGWTKEIFGAPSPQWLSE